jgi:hypothetical protein
MVSSLVMVSSSSDRLAGFSVGSALQLSAHATGLGERPQGNSGPHCSIAVSVGGMVSGSKRQTWSDER